MRHCLYVRFRSKADATRTPPNIAFDPYRISRTGGSIGHWQAATVAGAPSYLAISRFNGKTVGDTSPQIRCVPNSTACGKPKITLSTGQISGVRLFSIPSSALPYSS